MKTMVDILPEADMAVMYYARWALNAKMMEDGIKIELRNKILSMGDKFRSRREMSII